MIRIGVLGSANIAIRSVIPAILKLNNLFEFIGIASRSESEAKKNALLYNTDSFFGYDSILDKSLIDAIYIPLPNSLHYDWVKKSLEKGIQVLVEKSLGVNAIQVDELSRLAMVKKIAIVENFQFRFHPQFLLIRKILNNKSIGDVRYMRSSFEFPPFKDHTNIRYQKVLGGGALLDAGAYPLKLTSLILGDQTRVRSAVSRYDSEKGVDIGGGGLLEDPDGKKYSLISFGFDNYYQCSLEIFGSLGMIKSNRIFTSPPGVKSIIELSINGKEKQELIIEAENHFEKMCSYFHSVIHSIDLQKQEHRGNIRQAKLIEEFKNKSND